VGLGDAGEQARVELRFGRKNVFNPPRGVQRFHDGRVASERGKVKTVNPRVVVQFRWGEATDEPARGDARPTRKINSTATNHPRLSFPGSPKPWRRPLVLVIERKFEDEDEEEDEERERVRFLAEQT